MEHSTLMLAGDTHGDLHHLKYLIEEADEFGVEAIVVLGDFGYWEHQASGVYFLDYIEDKLKRMTTCKTLYFIDGNHENHTLLRRRYTTIETRASTHAKQQLEILEEKKGPWRPTQSPEGFWGIRNNVWYIPRGTIWQWNGVRLAALGGAYSIDINRRRSGTSWWPEEMIEPDEFDSFAGEDKVDIFFSHDAPYEVDMNTQFTILGRQFFKADLSTVRNRTYLSTAIAHVKPDYLFHGHYHLDYKTNIPIPDNHNVEVRGLGMNGMGRESFTIIDLKENSGR